MDSLARKAIPDYPGVRFPLAETSLRLVFIAAATSPRRTLSNHLFSAKGVNHLPNCGNTWLSPGFGLGNGLDQAVTSLTARVEI